MAAQTDGFDVQALSPAITLVAIKIDRQDHTDLVCALSALEPDEHSVEAEAGHHCRGEGNV